MVPINYFAVLVSTIVAMVLGVLWYGPLFGKQWSALMGVTPEDMQKMGQKSMSKEYTIQALGALLMSFMLEHAVIFTSTYLSLTGIAAGIFTGAGLWIGFVAPITVGMVLWEGKPWKHWGIVSGYWLATLVVMAIILSIWR